MARADSTIRVNIIGDAKSLTRAADTSQSAIGGMNKKIIAAGGIIAGAFATDALLDFGQTALREADRVGDATGRLEAQLGKFSKPLIDAADDFSKIGASEGDMLDLEARLADIGSAAGIADDKLGPMAQSAAVLASKMALATDTDADVWIDRIGKAAASDNARALRDLGVNLSDSAVAAQALADTGKGSVDALTDTELAAARAQLILADLEERYGTVGSASVDLEGRQAELQARWETLTGNIGAGLEGPLSDLLSWVLTGIDGWALLSERVGGFDKVMGDALAPVARMIDLQRTLIGVLARAIDLLNEFLGLAGQIGIGSAGITTPGPGGDLRRRQFQTSGSVTVNVQGGSPESIEQAVRDALRTAAGRGPLE